jgi:hypothetical protein
VPVASAVIVGGGTAAVGTAVEGTATAAGAAAACSGMGSIALFEERELLFTPLLLLLLRSLELLDGFFSFFLLLELLLDSFSRGITQLEQVATANGQKGVFVLSAKESTRTRLIRRQQWSYTIAGLWVSSA